MSERYKTITLDDFSDGEQCDLITPSKNSVKLSENLVIQKNKIKLGRKLKGGVLYDSGLSLFWENNIKISFPYNYYTYLATGNGSDILIKKVNMASGAWALVDTLPDSSGEEIHCFIKFRNLAIICYLNNAETANLIKYSTNGLGMTAWANTNLIALSGSGSFYIRDYKIVHDWLYILGSDSKIYYSDDGITFTVLVALDSSYSYSYLEYLSGYLYVVNVSKTSIFGLVRISLSGDIQDETVSLGEALYFSCRVFNGNLYVLLDNQYLYRIEGSNLVLVFSFSEDVSFLYSPGFTDSLFFKRSNEIIRMDIGEKISRPYDVLAAVTNINSLCRYGDRISSIQGHSGNSYAAIYEDAYTAFGNKQTRLVKIQGVPKQIVLRHKPLAANTSIKVYTKKDQASSWGDAVINSATTNAIKKVYDFPAGTELDFIEFKIEYLTSDSTKSPEDATIDFIYLPVGLANSK